MKILVTGACGYIGSHTLVDLIQNGYDVVSIDNLSNSDESSLLGVAQITGKEVRNYNFDLSKNIDWTEFIEQEGKIDGVIHFAALKAVGESTEIPLTYYKNNINSLINILELMDSQDIHNLIFSSSCTVYGNSIDQQVTENTAIQKAESPYGKTKQIGEDIIADWCKISKKSAICLRYFNPAGAHESCLLGESPINSPQNLVPIITETALGKRESFMVFGDNYNTRDGSCIRDYIHVMDLADGHTKALEYLIAHKNESVLEFYNLGCGNGVTVLEAIRAFEETNGISLNYSIGPRRDGDVIAIYADYSLAEKKLNWQPNRTINDIMKTAWEWEKKRNA